MEKYESINKKLNDVILRYPIGSRIKITTQYSYEEPLTVSGYEMIDENNLSIKFLDGRSLNYNSLSVMVVTGEDNHD